MKGLAPDWVRPWVGKPWAWNGRGPDAYDCWGLLRAVLWEQAGIVLPSREQGDPPEPRDWDEIEGVLKGEDRACWRVVARREKPSTPLLYLEPARALDGVVFRRGAHEGHVGVLVAPGWVLHAERGPHSVCEPIDDPRIRHRIVSIERHQDLDVRVRA